MDENKKKDDNGMEEFIRRVRSFRDEEDPCIIDADIKTCECVVNFEEGLNLRKSAALSKICVNSKCDVVMEHKGVLVNCKNIMSVLVQAIMRGEKVAFFLSGENKDDSMKELIEFFDRK